MVAFVRHIKEYHEQSKHHPAKFAESLGFMDWANQPNPFRSYEGTPKLDLPFLQGPVPGKLYTEAVEPKPVDLESVGALFELSLGLSAWKRYGDSRWALRMNPSSGNLHPTESYLVGLGGVYHYDSLHHQLERRAELPQWLAAGTGFWVGLSTITVRETWKYGVRGYRYCQLDLGHALGALGYSAALNGWKVKVLDHLSTDQVGVILGLDGVDWPPHQSEEPDMLLRIGPKGDEVSLPEPESFRPLAWEGEPNLLCQKPHPWRPVDQAYRLCNKPAGGNLQRLLPEGEGPAPSELSGETLIRQRRSGQTYSEEDSAMKQGSFWEILQACLPRRGKAPFDVSLGEPQVNLVLMVHRVEGVAPGTYLLCRNERDLGGLKAALDSRFAWDKVPTPMDLPLYLLEEGDTRNFAANLSCNQEIASSGSFSLSMLSCFEGAMKEDQFVYPRLFWECGLIGQALYLGAESQGFRGTGIGCYFDDQMHGYLGLTTASHQSLYHFTLGAAVEDQRLTTEPPYPEGRNLDR